MSIWNFNASNLENVKSPFTIVNDLCKELYQISEGRIVARVTEYVGKYRSENTNIISNNYNQMFSTAIKTQTPGFDVQDIMGDNAADNDFINKFVYELYVTSKSTSKYKYRVFIMYHDINMYPVGMTIQKDIAKEVECKSEGMFFMSEPEFRRALELILGSKTLGNVLRNILALNS